MGAISLLDMFLGLADRLTRGLGALGMKKNERGWVRRRGGCQAQAFRLGRWVGPGPPVVWWQIPGHDYVWPLALLQIYSQGLWVAR
jgi:hypothetical protein